MSTPERGSVADQMRELGGGVGINLYFKATIVCDAPVRNGRACCDSEKYEVPMDSFFSVDALREGAVEDFKSRGWKTEDGIRCPQCKEISDGDNDD